MPNRLIKDSILTSRKTNALSDFDFRIWVYLITYVDDYGRGSADPEILKGMVFPRRKGLTEQQISNALSNLANAGMINFYTVDGESYLYFPNWDKHQQIRAHKSKAPAPVDIENHPQMKLSDSERQNLISDDINGNQAKSADSRCTRNPIQSKSNTNPHHAHVREESGGDFLDEDEALRIQAEQNEVLDAAKAAGLPTSPKAMNTIVRLYTEHGKDRLLFAIDECVKYNKVSFAYVERVCSNRKKIEETGPVLDRGLEDWDT